MTAQHTVVVDLQDDGTFLTLCEECGVVGESETEDDAAGKAIEHKRTGAYVYDES